MEVYLKVRKLLPEWKKSDKTIGQISDFSEYYGKPVMVARFVMVARDGETGKAAKVNPLTVESDAEKALFRLGQGELLAEAMETMQPS